MANWYDNTPAPMDANGSEVPLSTKKLVYKDKTREVLAISYNVAAGLWVADLVNTVEYAFISACTLPDSWEQLEEDARKDAREYFGCGDGSIYNKCPSCPAYDDDCGPAMAQDVVRRAKALAGVTDGE